MKKIKSRLIYLLSSILFLMACSGGTSDVTTIKLGHTLDTQHPVHVSLEYFGEELARLSKGTMDVTIFSSGQLGNERELLELIQIGTIGMTKVSASSMEAFVPQMQVFTLPYLFNDSDHFWKTLNSDVGQRLLDYGRDYRVKGLGYFDAGSRSFYTTSKRVESPEDIAGMKIRVMNSQSAVDMVNTIGGSATPISFGELYTALQQGIVDGAENNPPSFYFSKHFEVSQYYLLDEHTSIPDVIVIGTHRWNSLNAQQQAWLKQAMDAATEFQKALWAESTQASLAAVKAAGGGVITADKSLFQAKVQPLYDRLEGQPIHALVKEIKALGESE